MLSAIRSLAIFLGPLDIATRYKETIIHFRASFWVVIASVFVVVALALPPVTLATMIDLTESGQGKGNKGLTFRPSDGMGGFANFTITARSSIDNTQPLDPNAAGFPGTVYIDAKGAGTQTSSKEGSTGISGGGGHKDEELIFTYDAPVNLSSIVLTLADIEFGNGMGDKDDPIIYLSLAGSGQFGVRVDENDILAAFKLNGDRKGDVDFSSFSSLAGQNAIDAFNIRETNGHIFVTGLSETTHAPEPGTMLMVGSGLIGLAGFRRKFRKN
jgi:hypothetical protein